MTSRRRPSKEVRTISSIVKTVNVDDSWRHNYWRPFESVSFISSLSSTVLPSPSRFRAFRRAPFRRLPPPFPTCPLTLRDFSLAPEFCAELPAIIIIALLLIISATPRMEPEGGGGERRVESRAFARVTYAGDALNPFSIYSAFGLGADV